MTTSFPCIPQTLFLLCSFLSTFLILSYPTSAASTNPSSTSTPTTTSTPTHTSADSRDSATTTTTSSPTPTPNSSPTSIPTPPSNSNPTSNPTSSPTVIPIPAYPKDFGLDKLPFSYNVPEYNYTVDLKGWTQFASKLKECRSTRMSLPNPVQITFIKLAIRFGGSKKMNGQLYTQDDIDALIQNTYQEYKILGWKKDQCIVTIEAKPFPEEYVSGYQLSEEFIKNTFPVTKVKCAFQKPELEILTQSAIQMEKEQGGSIPTGDPMIYEQAGQILSKTCHPEDPKINEKK